MANYRDDRNEWDEAHSAGDEERIVATGMLSTVFITVVYTVHESRRRIISAFEADDGDILDCMVTYAYER